MASPMVAFRGATLADFATIHSEPRVSGYLAGFPPFPFLEPPKVAIVSMETTGTSLFMASCLPGVSMTLKKWGHDPLILGDDPIFEGSWRLQVVFFGLGLFIFGQGIPFGLRRVS